MVAAVRIGAPSPISVGSRVGVSPQTILSRSRQRKIGVGKAIRRSRRLHSRVVPSVSVVCISQEPREGVRPVGGRYSPIRRLEPETGIGPIPRACASDGMIQRRVHGRLLVHTTLLLGRWLRGVSGDVASTPIGSREMRMTEFCAVEQPGSSTAS